MLIKHFIQEVGVVVTDHLYIDAEKYDVRWKGHPLRLTPSEMVVLARMARSKGQVYRLADISRTEGPNPYTDIAVKTHFRRLREKFRAVDPEFSAIKNVFGLGYKWEEPKE